MGAAEKATTITRLVNYRTAVVAHDLAMVAAAWTLSYLIPYNFSLSILGFSFLQLLPVVLLAQGIVLWWLGLYRGVWRFASIPDLWNIMRAVMAGSQVAGSRCSCSTGCKAFHAFSHAVSIAAVFSARRAAHGVPDVEGLRVHAGRSAEIARAC